MCYDQPRKPSWVSCCCKNWLKLSIGVSWQCCSVNGGQSWWYLTQISCFGGDIKEGGEKCIYAIHAYIDVLISQYILCSFISKCDGQMTVMTTTRLLHLVMAHSTWLYKDSKLEIWAMERSQALATRWKSLLNKGGSNQMLFPLVCTQFLLSRNVSLTCSTSVLFLWIIQYLWLQLLPTSFSCSCICCTDWTQEEDAAYKRLMRDVDDLDSDSESGFSTQVGHSFLGHV